MYNLTAVLTDHIGFTVRNLLPAVGLVINGVLDIICVSSGGRLSVRLLGSISVSNSHPVYSNQTYNL